MTADASNPLPRILTCPACGDHFRQVEGSRDCWATCSRCRTRFEIPLIPDHFSSEVVGVGGLDAKPRRGTKDRNRPSWLLAIFGSFGISVLLGLSIGVVPAEAAGGICCCGPMMCFFLATRLAWLARQELDTDALDKTVNWLVLVLLTSLFALALLIVFIHSCAAVVLPASLR